jgi:hypothetical protein
MRDALERVVAYSSVGGGSRGGGDEFGFEMTCPAAPVFAKHGLHLLLKQRTSNISGENHD